MINVQRLDKHHDLFNKSPAEEFSDLDCEQNAPTLYLRNYCMFVCVSVCVCLCVCVCARKRARVFVRACMRACVCIYANHTYMAGLVVFIMNMYMC